ncbi:MAG: ABC transporter ATP-binding protein [Acidobacteria bacterium]|nr:ABC transporter ATP-binding protein [Acidobacteriota bacterium]MBV9925277.1 ABC transporter ATP-binding protein [Acidobacteriota bacterium]
MEFAVDVRGVSRRYGRRWALAEVSLAVPTGAVAMIAGSNGSGKSTLLRILATAIRPDLGDALVGGFSVKKEREDVRRLTALLSHYSYLYEALNARENLSLFGDPNAVLARVGLAARAEDPISSYSAGMRKRLSFARVLLQQPKVVLLDEPYGQLDPEGFRLVDEVVSELRGKATIVMATHQVERVGKFADVKFELAQGRLR